MTYDEKTEEVYIPNQEITQEFLNVVDEPAWDGLIQALNRSEELLYSRIMIKRIKFINVSFKNKSFRKDLTNKKNYGRVVERPIT